METGCDNNENIPNSPSRLLPAIKIPKHEPLSPKSPSPQVPIQGPQDSSHESPSPSSSDNSMHESNSMPPTTTTITIASYPMTSSSSLSCNSTNYESHNSMPLTTTTIRDHPVTPPSPSDLSRPLQIPMPESPSTLPPPQQLLSHQMQPLPYYYPPLGMPPPFPYYSAPYPHHDQFHPFYYPMIPGNNVSNGQVFSQPWSTGLFDCFSDLKNCFITCLCPCVTFGQVDEIFTEGKMVWWEGALMFGLLETLCFSSASFVFAWYHRAQFRKKYNLMGNLLSEFAITLFCTRLVLCQNYRQLNRLGFDVALGWKANKKKQRRIASQAAAAQFVPPMVNPGMFR